MIPVRIACLIVLAATWHAWVLLADRVTGASLATTLILSAVLVWRLGRGAEARVGVAMVAALLSACAAAALTGVALLEMGAGVGTLVVLLWPRERWPVLGLAALALPVLPTLDFLLAYPLRRVSALIAGGLLRMNGVGVGVEGVALDWHGQRLLFDGPCSGVRMLWAALMLASLVALVRRLDALRYAGLLAAAIVAAVFGNALRAASLFYLENGFVAGLDGPVAHEMVGIVAFAMLAALLLAAAPRARRFA